jgi:sterol desaturase/sphingolipid hydroxylase (fatty acid hydroxylase superfamily)
VHHAANASCLDRNYGGVLIVFDRLFGTFAEPPEAEPLRYGVVGAAPSYNPFAIALGQWIAMLRDARRADGPAARLSALFGPPKA